MRVFGAFNAMPRGGSNIRMRPITVKIGKPLKFTAADVAEDQGEGRKLYQQLSERVMTAIAAIEAPTKP